MSIERRLHHAGRELREIPIEPPTRIPTGRPRAQVGARAMSTLAPVVVLAVSVLGAVALLRIESPRPAPDAVPAVASTNPPARVIEPAHLDAAPGHEYGGQVAGALSALEEIALISELGSDVTDAVPAPDDELPPNLA